jgi:hypothetical protein
MFPTADEKHLGFMLSSEVDPIYSKEEVWVNDKNNSKARIQGNAHNP